MFSYDLLCSLMICSVETEIPYSLRDCIDSPTVTETADLLETVKVSDLRGNEIPISDLWKDRKAVVAFARHFGC